MRQEALIIAVEHPGNRLKAHKELSREVHVGPSLRICGRRRPSLPQRAVLGDECLESEIENIEALGSVRHGRVSEATARR